MTWVYYPAERIWRLTRDVCYAKGMAHACADMHGILRRGDLDMGGKLQALRDYPNAPPYPHYQPDLQPDAGEEYHLLTGQLEDEARHGYIRGRHDAAKLVRDMMSDGRSDVSVLAGILAFCEAILDITGGETNE